MPLADAVTAAAPLWARMSYFVQKIILKLYEISYTRRKVNRPILFVEPNLEVKKKTLAAPRTLIENICNVQ